MLLCDSYEREEYNNIKLRVRETDEIVIDFYNYCTHCIFKYKKNNKLDFDRILYPFIVCLSE